MGSSAVEMGRARQRLPLLNPRQWAWLVVGAAIGGLFLMWHLALVITAGVPVVGVGVTLRGIITAKPLSLGARYPADGTAVAAWAVLVVLEVVGVILVRRWWMGRHQDTPLGFASAKAAEMSAGERRARDKARWSRRGSVARGFDPDTAPLNQVGFLLGHERGAGEPVVLTLGGPDGDHRPHRCGEDVAPDRRCLPGRPRPVGGDVDAPGDPGRHRGGPHRPRAGLGVRPAQRRLLARTHGVGSHRRRAGPERRQRPRVGVRRWVAGRQR